MYYELVRIYIVLMLSYKAAPLSLFYVYEKVGAYHYLYFMAFKWKNIEYFYMEIAIINSI